MSGAPVAATLFGPQDLRIVGQDLPPLPAGMVRVRFGAGGICGSDMHYFRHGRTGDFVATSPLILGHEVAGEIAEAGEGVSGLAPGDRVAVNPSRWCGSCAYCREGRENLCDNIYFMGSASRTPHMQGGFASLFDATPAQCVKVPDHMSYASAALAEPLAVALHAVARAGDLGGRPVAIFGAGPIGLLILMAALRERPATTAVLDIARAPLDFAASLGAGQVIDLSRPDSAPDKAFDICFEVSGTAAGLSSAITAARRGGIVVQVGNLPGGSLPVPANAVMAKEIDLRGTFRFGREFATAVRLIGDGAIAVDRLITAERPLSQAPEAFRLALDRSRSVKVILRDG